MAPSAPRNFFRVHPARAGDPVDHRALALADAAAGEGHFLALWLAVEGGFADAAEGDEAHDAAVLQGAGEEVGVARLGDLIEVEMVQVDGRAEDGFAGESLGEQRVEARA